MYFVKKLELEENQQTGYIEVEAKEKFTYHGEIVLKNG